MTIRPVEPRDRAAWMRMREALWPGTHDEDVSRYFAGRSGEPAAVLLAFDGEDGERAVGFIELSIRPYAEGCVTNRVAFIEGWYVDPAARRVGVGRALVEAAAAWGCTQGCRELASDADVGDEVSARAHRSLGFEETAVIRCFRRSLD